VKVILVFVKLIRANKQSTSCTAKHLANIQFILVAIMMFLLVLLLNAFQYLASMEKYKNKKKATQSNTVTSNGEIN
jgi:large-conductance mechanosensitive channel